MKTVRVTGVQILTPFMGFLTTFLNFSKLISSLKAQVCNILKNYICAADFSLLNLPKGKSLGRSKPVTNS